MMLNEQLDQATEIARIERTTITADEYLELVTSRRQLERWDSEDGTQMIILDTDSQAEYVIAIDALFARSI